MTSLGQRAGCPTHARAVTCISVYGWAWAYDIELLRIVDMTSDIWQPSYEYKLYTNLYYYDFRILIYGWVWAYDVDMSYRIWIKLYNILLLRQV